MRRKAVTFLLGAIVACVALFLGVVLLLPAVVKSRFVGAAARASGLRVTCGDVALRGTTLRLGSIVVCAGDCSADDPFVLTVGSVRVEPDAWSLFTGSPRPRRIQVEGIALRADLSSAERYGKIFGAIEGIARSLGGAHGGKRGRGDPGAQDGAGAGAAGKKGGGGKKGSPAVIPIESSGVSLDVLMPGGVRLRCSGASNAPGEEGGGHRISLGRTRIDAGRLSIDADDLSLTAGVTGSGSPTVGEVSMRHPQVTVRLPQVGEWLALQEEEGAAEGEAGEGGENDNVKQEKTISNIIEHIKNLQGEMAFFTSLFPAPLVVHAVGGDVKVFTQEGTDPAWQLTQVSGRLTLDFGSGEADGGVVGEIGGLPFMVDARAGRAQVEAEADIPPVRVYLKRIALLGRHARRVDTSLAKGDFKGTVALDLEKGTVDVSGRMGLRDFTVEHPGLSTEPLADLWATFTGALEVTQGLSGVEAGAAQLQLNGFPLSLSSLNVTREEGGGSWKLAAAGSVPVTDCQKLFAALPPGFRSRLEGFSFTGVLGATFSVGIDAAAPEKAAIDFALDNRCEVVGEGGINLGKYNGVFVHEVEDKLGQHSFVMGPGSGNWADYDEISPYVTSAVITSEDGGFYLHKGVSASAIKRAVKQDLKARGFFSGASTITMQLSKNLFLSREKTIARKVQEMIISWWVEKSMDKEGILELYLNVIEYGPELYGIRSAAQHYFGKEPADLTLLESVFLVKMLPNPVGRYRYYEDALETGGLDPKWRAVLDRVATKMFERGYITKEELDESLAAPFSFSPGGAETAPPGENGEGEGGEEGEEE